MFVLSGVMLLVAIILLVVYCVKVRKEKDDSDPLRYRVASDMTE